MIEKRFNVPFVAALALREKQIQQSYRPIIAVHKWFARRPGTLFRGLLLAEFGKGALEDAFYRSNDLAGVRVADPFMGGGTPLIEANRVGCEVVGFDVNPMAAWIVREEIQGLDLRAYEQAVARLLSYLADELGRYYRTACSLYGEPDVPVKSFLWVKVLECERCGGDIDLFPGYLVARNVRHPRSVVVCGDCGELNEIDDLGAPGACMSCGAELRLAGPAGRGKCPCPACGHVNRYPRGEGPADHRMFAIEYHNPARKAEHRGRFFKKPDADDIARVEAARERCERLTARFVPDESIPAGDETNRLHRWGYRRYSELFNPRQRLGLELSCRWIVEEHDERLRRALATNLSDLLRYQNMLCRYDTTALKALDVFSVHGFPVGLVQCESNLLGIPNGTGANVGSGGWSNITQKYAKAKAYCQRPYEVRRIGSRNQRVPIAGERIGTGPNGRRQVSIRCRSATESDLAPKSLDAVLTDPPYFGNVQYAELMDFCYVWLRRLAGPHADGFGSRSTRSAKELTGNQTASRGIEEFAEGLSEVYRRMAIALKPGAPLAFTYHHNKVDAYAAVAVAILDAGFACTAALPCPAEMGGSIHIHGTGSSIIDTVFVCRRPAGAPTPAVPEDRSALIDLVAEDAVALTMAGRRPTRGDLRCVLLGQATRAAVEVLRDGWDAGATTGAKLVASRRGILRMGDLDEMVMEVGRVGDELVRVKQETDGFRAGVEKQLALPV